jgi:soluble lytic murein transglycosylase-like protein
MAQHATADQEMRSASKAGRLRRALFIAGSLGLLLASVLCVIEAYVSFKYPIKWDRYRHEFSTHFMDRTRAYVLLLRSSSRSGNAAMTVESIQQIVEQTGEKYGVDACLVTAVVTFESAFNPNTITTTGAMGLMALQPATASVLSVHDPFDPEQNVDGGTRLLAELVSAFHEDIRLVLAAYNAGSGAVRRYDGVPPFRETQDYVSQVGTIYSLCRAQPTSFFAPRSDQRP